jgi:hypothetical protein
MTVSMKIGTDAVAARKGEEAASPYREGIAHAG